MSRQIKLNENATIRWVVTGQQMPAQSTVCFPGTSGIVFKTGYNWPGSTPTVDPTNNSVYSATDAHSPGQPGNFPNTTTVTFTDANGNSQDYSYDPDVDNLGTPIKTCISPGVAAAV